MITFSSYLPAILHGYHPIPSPLKLRRTATDQQKKQLPYPLIRHSYTHTRVGLVFKTSEKSTATTGHDRSSAHEPDRSAHQSQHPHLIRWGSFPQTSSRKTQKARGRKKRKPQGGLSGTIQCPSHTYQRAIFKLLRDTHTHTGGGAFVLKGVLGSARSSIDLLSTASQHLAITTQKYDFFF